MVLVIISMLLLSSSFLIVQSDPNPSSGDSVTCQHLRQYPLDIVPISSQNCTATSINFRAGAVYLIQSIANDEVVDLQDSNTKTRNPIITYPRNGGQNQQWIARASQAANSFNLVTMIPGSPSRALTYNSWESKTMLHFLHDGLSQRWYIGKQCGQFVQIRSNVRNANSGNTCLTRTGAGKPMDVVVCKDSNENQLWKLILV